MIYYFSGTGNSRGVAEFLADCLGDEVRSLMDAVGARDTQEKPRTDEAVGIVFPVYGWRPPEIVLRLLSRLLHEVNPGYLYFVCTCGDDTGKTSRVFSRFVEALGRHCRAGFSVTMPNTYVCLPGFDVDPPEKASAKLSAAPERIKEIALHIKKRRAVHDCHEGAMPWLKTYVLGAFFKRHLMSPAPFRATVDCVSCGACAKVCPLQNIHLENGRPVWGLHCAVCLSCYHHCPKHAVAYGNRTRHKGQYLFRRFL